MALMAQRTAEVVGKYLRKAFLFLGHTAHSRHNYAFEMNELTLTRYSLIIHTLVCARMMCIRRGRSTFVLSYNDSNNNRIF